jgi:hypothetical protein
MEERALVLPHELLIFPREAKRDCRSRTEIFIQGFKLRGVLDESWDHTVFLVSIMEDNANGMSLS